MKNWTHGIFAASFVFMAHASAEAACGNLEVAKGSIKILSGKTKQESVAAVGSKLCSGDTIISGADSRAKVKMEDGNELNISPDSKIVLETYLYSAADNRKKVLLNILQGKVRAATKQENMYNDKAKDGAMNSFQVKTKTAVAGVRGTDFLTSFDPKTNAAEVVTFRGKVEFGQLDAKGALTNSVSVVAGEKTTALPGQPVQAPTAIPKTELQKLNTETKGDSANNSTAAPNANASNDKKSSGNAKEDGRAPSSTTGSSGSTGSTSSSGSGSMVSSDDLAGKSNTSASSGTTSNVGATTPTANLPARLPTALPTVPVCDQCNQAIQQSGSAKVNIQIEVKK